VHPAAQRPADALAGEGFWVSAEPTDHGKCIRCWHRRPDVGAVVAHPAICARCATNVEGAGESREFA
jgi:isoleucyl-tRNA synthetase